MLETPFRVLCVDDDISVQRTLSTRVSAIGALPVSAGTVQEAKSRLENLAFDASVIDMVLDPQNPTVFDLGEQVMEFVRNAGDGTGIMVLTGHATDSESASHIYKKFKDDIIDYISKLASNEYERLETGIRLGIRNRSQIRGELWSRLFQRVNPTTRDPQEWASAVQAWLRHPDPLNGVRSIVKIAFAEHFEFVRARENYFVKDPKEAICTFNVWSRTQGCAMVIGIGRADTFDERVVREVVARRSIASLPLSSSAGAIQRQYRDEIVIFTAKIDQDRSMYHSVFDHIGLRM